MCRLHPSTRGSRNRGKEEVVIIKCECGDSFELPEGFFDSKVAYEFWQRHGHFPDSIKFVCDCGAKRLSGPSTGLGPEECGTQDAHWVKKHSHLGVVRQEWGAGR